MFYIQNYKRFLLIVLISFCLFLYYGSSSTKASNALKKIDFELFENFNINSNACQCSDHNYGIKSRFDRSNRKLESHSVFAVIDSLMSNQNAIDLISQNSCSSPSEQSEYLLSEPYAIIWFSFQNITKGDTLRWNWYDNNDVLITTYNSSTAFSGNGCWYAYMEINSTSAILQTGEYKVNIYRNDSLIVTKSFTITSENNSKMKFVAPILGSFLIIDEFSRTNATTKEWSFWQHKSPAPFNPKIGHIPRGGIQGADDTYAYDINLNLSKISSEKAAKDLDKGMNFYPIAPGRIVTWHGSNIFPSDGNSILIEHDNNDEKFWSGYIHAETLNKDLYVGKPVFFDTTLGRIGSAGTSDNNHLHLVIYEGENNQDNSGTSLLRSTNVDFEKNNLNITFDQSFNTTIKIGNPKMLKASAIATRGAKVFDFNLNSDEYFDNYLWKSSDKSTVSVDGRGNIIGIKGGTANITVYFSGEKATTEVKVINSNNLTKDLAIDSLTLSPNKVNVGETMQLQWSILNNGNTDISGSYYEDLYFSLDEKLDSSDYYFYSTQMHNVNLEPEEKHQSSLALTFSGGHGIFFILVNGDAGNNILEDNEDNNVASAKFTLN